MPRYLIKVEQTRYYEIDAESEDEALEEWYMGEHIETETHSVESEGEFA